MFTPYTGVMFTPYTGVIYWVHRGCKFYNRLMKLWLKNSDIEIYSTNKESKLLVAEQLID